MKAINTVGKTDGQMADERNVDSIINTMCGCVYVGECFSQLCHGGPSRLTSFSVGIVFLLALIRRAPAKLLILLKRCCLICCFCLKIYRYRETTL